MEDVDASCACSHDLMKRISGRRRTSVRYSSDRRPRSDEAAVEVHFEKAVQHHGRKATDRPRFGEGRQAFCHRQRAMFLESGEELQAIAERDAVVRVPEKVLGIPKTTATVDFVLCLPHEFKTSPVGGEHQVGIHDTVAVGSIDQRLDAVDIGYEEIADIRLIGNQQRRRIAPPRMDFGIDVQKACDITGDLGAEGRRSVALQRSSGIERLPGRHRTDDFNVHRSLQDACSFLIFDLRHGYHGAACQRIRDVLEELVVDGGRK